MSKTKKKSNNNLTLTEFKAWIKGIQEFQSDDWVPSRQQWKAIVEKIMALEEGYADHVRQPETRNSPPAQSIDYARYGHVPPAQTRLMEYQHTDNFAPTGGLVPEGESGMVTISPGESLI